MEITMDMYEVKLEELMKEYNKISSIGMEYLNPPFFEIFMSFVDFFFIEELYDVKSNVIVASIFELFSDMNNIKADLYESVLATLRVKSKKSLISKTKDYLLDLVEIYKGMYLDDDVKEVFDLNFDHIESIKDGEGEYFHNKYSVLVVNSNHLGLMRQLDMFFKNQDMYEIQQLNDNYISKISDILEVQDIVEEYEILTSLYTEKILEYDIDNKGLLFYNLILFYPLAFRTISHLLNYVKRDDIELLLECYLEAFERVNLKQLEELDDEFTQSRDFREYLFCLDGIGLIYKTKFIFDKAITHLEKGLKYASHTEIDFRVSLLNPYMLSGQIEKYLLLRNKLHSKSIVRCYLELYDDVLEEVYDIKVFKCAFNSSNFIMSALVNETPNIYEMANTEEKKFLEDFYLIFKSQRVLIEYINKEFKRVDKSN